MNGSDDLSERFAELGPWIYQFRIGGHDYGGGISAVGDERLERFFRYCPHAETILELGALEGAHTFIMAKAFPSSTFVGCWTDKSAGFAPLRIWPV